MLRTCVLTAAIAMLIVTTAHAAGAPALGPIPQPPTERLPIDPDEASIPCDQILNRLNQYNDMARAHDQSVAGFLGQVVQKMGEWHAQLKPLENTTQTLPEGTFTPLQEGAERISLVTDRAYDNAELLSIEMSKLLVAVRDCAEQNARARARRGNAPAKRKK